MRCLFGDDDVVSLVQCKHGYQRPTSNFNRKFVRF